MPRHTRATIHLDHIRHNYELVNRLAPQSKNMAIIKANAYGHGLIEVANSLSQLVPAFGVAIFEEALTLRDSGIQQPILVLQGVNHAQDYQLASELGVWVTLHNLEQLSTLLATPIKKPITVWLKLDTGMHRLGMNQTELQTAVEKVLNCSWINDDFIVSSHYSCASQSDNLMTQLQFERFNQMLSLVKLGKPVKQSIANSPAIVGFPESNLDWNRPGIMLYGVAMFDSQHDSDKLTKPAMTFESEVIAIREIKTGEAVGYGKKWIASSSATIATVAVGYADGYPRQAKSGTPVFINGKVAKLVGCVSMDLITIDISLNTQVKIGDRVELWGENIPVSTVAEHADTIGYDLVSGVSQRVPREYR